MLEGWWVGSPRPAHPLSDSYSTGSATGTGDNVGGLVGNFLTGTISTSYSAGAVSGGGSNVGGLVGKEGDSGVTISASYWDTDTSGVSTVGAGTGKTTMEMKALTGAEDSSGWGELSWHFGDEEKYPAVRTYEEMPAGTQVQGSVICGQLSPRAVCEPRVSISAVTGGESVSEGAAAMFTLARDGATTGALTVKVSVTGGEGFIDSTPPATAMFVVGDSTATYSVPTVQDTMDEADGTVTVTVNDASGDYAAKQGMGSATVQVADDDLPVVSISGGSAVTEGTAAEFTLTRVGDTTGALTVTVSVSGGDSFLSGTAPTGTVFGAGDATATLSVATAGDDMDEADGTLTVTVSPMPSVYTLSGSVSAMVAVADDDLPLVSIAGGASITEGTAAEFTVTRVGDTTAALSVKVTVGGGAGFLPSPVTAVVDGTAVDAIGGEAGSFMVMIGIAATEVVFGVATEGDGLDEADGMIEAMVTAVDGSYRVDATDPPVLTTVSASVAVTDDDLPLVSIGEVASVVEGEAAEFTVSREGVTTAALSVKVTVAGGAGFLPSPVTAVVDGTAVDAIGGEAGSFMVMIGIAATEVVFGVATEGDGLDEVDGMIEATVTAVDGSYHVDAADPPVSTTVSASVNVTDDDLPSITSFEIEGRSGSIAEDADPKTITVTVPEGTSLVDLDPTVVAVRSDATVAPAGRVTFVDGRAQDFTVTAGGDTVTYQVTVNVVVGTPPGVPGGFSAVAGVEQVTLSWTAPTELGSTGTLSRYEYRQTQGMAVSPWTAVEPLTALTQVVGGLVADVVYGFEIRAVGSTELAGDATAKQEATPLAVGALMFMGAIAAQTYTKDTVILDLVLPVAMGGMGPYRYTLDPVPSGLEFDAATRTLSGTPATASTTATTHTYTVTDSTAVTALTAALTFMITVNEAETIFGIGSQGAAVHVYPNPAGDVLHIEFPGAGDYGIALLTLTGQPVLGEWHAGGGAQILDLSSLTKGVYFLKIEDSEGVSHTFRIIR